MEFLKRIGLALRKFHGALLGLVLVTVLLAFGYRLNTHLPFREWLAFRYVGYFSAASVPLLVSAATGHAVVFSLVGRRWATAERLTVGAALGLVIFSLGWMALGFLHLYGPVAMVLWPLALLVAGLPSLWRDWPSLLRWRRRVQAKERALTLTELALAALAVFGLLLAYAPILTPQNIAFDARWYHLPLAERYSVEGGIFRSPEGWFFAGYPHLASILYSWCFCLPVGTTFDRVELCAHFEFMLLLVTLAGIPVLARVLLPNSPRVPRFAFAVLFLFPEFFLYDSNLNGGADHLAAFWAVPVFLASLRVFRRWETRGLVVLSFVVSGVLLTKYTAYGLLVGPAFGLAVRLLWLLGIRLRRREAPWSLLTPALLALGLIAALTTPYWLKNLFWYSNPVFPLAAGLWPPTPWDAGAADRLAAMSGGGWTPSRDWKGVQETLIQPLAFSFIPRDWPTFHRDWPMFGSLFTLLSPVVLFRRTRALVGLLFCANLGVIFWFSTYHQDRYLQAYLPWMAVFVVAAATLACSLGILPKLAVAALVGLQWLWGADAPFFGTHAMVGQPLRATLEHLAGGFAGRPLAERLVAYPEFESMRLALPKKSRVLRHEMQMHLGLGFPTVGDWFQSGISWTDAPSPSGIDRRLRGLGITHLAWNTGRSLGYQSVGSDVVFFDYAVRRAGSAEHHGGYSLARIATGAGKGLPKRELLVLYLGSDPVYPHGVYGAAQLSNIPYVKARTHPVARRLVNIHEDLTAIMDDVDAVVWWPRVGALVRAPGDLGFVVGAQRAQETIFVRQPGRTAKNIRAGRRRR